MVTAGTNEDVYHQKAFLDLSWDSTMALRSVSLVDPTVSMQINYKVLVTNQSLFHMHKYCTTNMQ